MPLGGWLVGLTQVTVVLDRHGTTVKNQDSEMMRNFFDLFSHYYPNKLAKASQAAQVPSPDRPTG